MPQTTFYWHDYETWGANPKRDRAAQFAGIRTDLNFNQIGEPLVVYAKPADDFLPQPGACMVTGLTPQKCRDEGVPEADFFRFIHDELARPGTCGLGYNTIRFDDEVSRFGFYRNFFNPYEREYRNGNSRWDLIDVVRLTRALRPDGIEWPTREDGVTSFRLEDLTRANKIAHEGAHDALSDVRATIALAKLIKEKQGRLFDYVFGMRDKKKLAEVLNIRNAQPVVHVSARYPAALGCIATVLPLAIHPRNKNEIIVYDLRMDPEPLISLSADEIRERVFTRTEDLADGEQRIPLKSIRINRAPVVVPMNTLTDEARQAWSMPQADENDHLERLRRASGLAEKVADVFADRSFESSRDPDVTLYDGFLSPRDTKLCTLVRKTDVADLADLNLVFDDPKLVELLFRYRARNWPESLSAADKGRWDEFRQDRIMNPESEAGINLKDYQRTLTEMAIDTSLTDHQRQVVSELLDWPAEIGLV